MGVRREEEVTREPWEDLIDAEIDYADQVAAMYASGIVEEQIRLALASFAGRDTALLLLRDAPVEMITRQLGPLFEIAANRQSLSWIAREILARIDPNWLAPRLVGLVQQQLDNADPVHAYDDYRGVAELLDRLGQRSILADVVRRAEMSTDVDVLEVAEDYRTARAGGE
jgi:hypothetical protein